MLNCDMNEFRLRNIPADAWKSFKAVCALEGKTVNDKIIELVKGEAERLDRLMRGKKE